MKPRFEEREGKLFRMLEEPVPLTPDAEMPCLVRLIQDDSPMGRYNRDVTYFDVIGKLFVAQKIKENPVYSNTLHAYEKNSLNQDYCIASIHTLEIIGYPVEEGSAEWALWAMMEENKVINSNGIVPFTLTDDRIVRIDDSVSWDVGHWLRIFDDTTGWQLYKEPEPQYKVGDWVECNGNQRLIEVIGRDLGRGNYYHFAHGFGGAYANSITRKLSPSEIIVKIGCLEGRVEDLSYADNGRFWLIGKATERFPVGMYSILYDDMLDTHTRKLVESLLEAQEDNNG
jgi:hypothetical protein